MAIFLPSFNSCKGRMTNGERKFSKKVLSLEYNFACWYDIPVGKRQKYSDL